MKSGRTALLILLAMGVLLVPLTTGAQQPAGRKPRIGFLGANSASATTSFLRTLRESLREQNYVEGQNIGIEWRFADGKIERLPGLADELVSLKPDLILVSTSSAAIAAKDATTTIPIVFNAVPDPVAIGLVKSLARPGGNVTGVTAVQADLAQKRLAILKEAVPDVRKVGVLRPSIMTEGAVTEMKRLETGAKSLAVELHVEEVSGPEAFDRVLAAMKKARVGAVIVIPNPIFYNDRAQLVALSTQMRLPLMSWVREFTEIGAPIAYGVRNTYQAQRMAVLAARILKGAKPADLPVEEPTRFELSINVKAAKALGLTIPPSLVLRADHVIE
jgi:putative ABC transport system substrate-binding protein